MRDELERMHREQSRAEEATPTEGESASPPDTDLTPDPSYVALDGYVEANWSYNFNRPSNDVTDYRGFDNRHNSFTLSNALLGVSFDHARVLGRLSLQVGHTPATYYSGEPLSPGGGGSATTDDSLFRFIQEAWAGYNVPLGSGVELTAGVFLSHIGYEGIAVKDNFNWSRSNLFFGLPFYHAGAKATYKVHERVSAMFMVANGVTGVVDNNGWKSVSTQWLFEPVLDGWTLSLVYFGGPERPRGAPEQLDAARDWRHLFDVWTEVTPVESVTLAAQGDGGFENNAFGTSWWIAGAAYVQVRPTDWIHLAARGDVFREHAATGDAGSAARIFWPSSLIGSGTFTVDVRPLEQLSIRAEYRHDEARDPMFFDGAVAGNGVQLPFVPNATRQDTVTLGLTGWFDVDVARPHVEL